MSLKQESESEPVVDCACCLEPSTGDCWDKPLCAAHWAAWAFEAPSAGEIEARATPEHIERRVVNQFMPDMVVLHEGVLKKYYRAWTNQWVRRKAELAAAAAETEARV